MHYSRREYGNMEIAEIIFKRGIVHMKLQEKRAEAEEIVKKANELEKKVYKGKGCLTSITAFILILIIFGIIGEKVVNNDKLMTIIWSSPIVLGIIASIISKRENKVKKLADEEEIKKLDEKFGELYEEIVREIETSNLEPIELQSNLILKKGEIPLLEYDAIRVISKEKVVRYKNSSSGASIRITKGVSYRVSGGKSTPVREKVDEKYLGKIILTNKRIVFSAREKGFEIPLNKITTIDKYSDGFYIQEGEKNYTLISSISVWIDFYLEKILQANINEQNY